MAGKKSKDPTVGKTAIHADAKTKPGRAVKRVLNDAVGAAVPLPPDQMASAAAGGLLAAAASTAVGAVPVVNVGALVAGAAAGALVAPDTNKDGVEADRFGKSIDEIGAFYGMLQLKLRSHAPVRAAYSAASVWFTLVIAEILTYFASYVRKQIAGDDSVLHGPMTIVDAMDERAGLSRSLKRMYTRSLNRTEAEQNACKPLDRTEEVIDGQTVPEVKVRPPCSQRFIERGSINLGLGRGNVANRKPSDPQQPTQSWACRMQDTDREVQLPSSGDPSVEDQVTINSFIESRIKKGENNGAQIMVEQICAPPENWWEEVQDDYRLLIEKRPKLFKSVKDQVVQTWDGEKPFGKGIWSVAGGLVDLFGSVFLAFLFVMSVSILYGVMSYYNVVWNMAKIKGRCEDDPDGNCADDLLTLQMAVDDKGGNSGGMQSLWDPVAQGTMGWLVADVLLSSLFL
jgi:hypothetical protein